MYEPLPPPVALGVLQSPTRVYGPHPRALTLNAMNDEQLVAAFQRHGVLPPWSWTPVVQFEMVDLDPVSQQLLWMEGRGFDWKAIAEGRPEARNPGEDNPFQWPATYVERLLRELHGSTEAHAAVVEAKTAASQGWTQPNVVIIQVGDDAREAEVVEALRGALPQSTGHPFRLAPRHCP